MTARLTLASVTLLTASLAACAPPLRAQEAPPARDAELAEPAALTYVGRVLDENGRPVEGATAFADNGVPYQTCRTIDEIPWRDWVPDPLAAADLGPRTVRGAAVSGADGRFRVEGVAPPVGGWVRVVPPGDVAAQVDVVPAMLRDGVVDVGDIVVEGGAVLAATVRDEAGNPLAGAWVVARPFAADGDLPPVNPEAPGEVRVGRTSEKGGVILHGLRERRHHVAAFTATHPPVVREERVRSGRSSSANFRLVPGGTCTVSVRWRGTTTPVEGARVTLTAPDAGLRFPGPAPLGTATTDADGVARLEGLSADVTEFVAGVVPPDFAADGVHHPGAFHVGAEGRVGGTLAVELDRPLPMTLSVIDAETKAPIADAKVKLASDWTHYDRTGGSPVDLTAREDAASARYVVDAARAGPWNIDVFAQGRHPVSIASHQHHAESAARPLVVAMTRATAVAFGRVVARTGGAPLAGAVVSSYEWVERMSDGNRVAATTDAAGMYRLDGCLGAVFPIRVEARVPGYVPATVEVDCTDRVRAGQSDGNTQMPDIALWRAGAVRGRIVGADGRPRPAAPVSLLLGDGRARSKREYACSVAADAAGRFAFENLPPGTYTIDIGLSVAKTPPSATVTIAEGEVVERELVGE